MKFLILFAFLSLSSVAAGSNEGPRPFVTDYCTNYPEGTLKNPEAWKDCCLEHDLYFWAGGMKQDRDQADLTLKSCVEKAGHPIQAQIIYRGIKIGYKSPIKYPRFKWNNGWPERASTQKLTLDDIEKIEKEIFAGYDYISTELKSSFVQSLKKRLE